MPGNGERQQPMKNSVRKSLGKRTQQKQGKRCVRKYRKIIYECSQIGVDIYEHFCYNVLTSNERGL